MPTKTCNIVDELVPDLRFVDGSGASTKFLTELQNIVGIAGEPYQEPSFLLRVDPLPKGADLP